MNSNEKSVVDTYHTPKRAEDFSVVARVASFAMKWQWVLWLIVSTAIAAGFDFKTPSQKFNEVQAQVASNKDELTTRMDASERRMAEVLTILNGLAIDACDRLKDNRYARAQLSCEERRQP